MRVHGIQGDRSEYGPIYESLVSTPVQFASMFSALGIQSPNCELFLNGRWYPITLGTHCTEDESKLFSSVTLQGNLSIGDTQESVYLRVPSHMFRTETGDIKERSVREVLVSLGLRPLTMSTVEHNLKLLNAERAARETGRTVWIKGPVLIVSNYEWWSRTQSRSLGTEHSPRKAIIEPELEACESNRGYFGAGAENVSRLPFVRVFSLDTKRYVYADVEDITDYEFDSDAIGRLHLPPKMLSILTTVFTAPSEEIFGDLIAGKHGGIVILASGNPGVGKTLTAEVYSEMTERPLYVLELGELGTTPSEVEENLNRVFTRVARWDAVLQFDECEIFLARRGNDLERSAIVGIFLRLLDYYRGILFLTTNRPDVIDEAVLSRVTLGLQYPDLEPQARRKVWMTMLEIAGLSVESVDATRLATLSLNGRQIRNVVRLAKVVYSEAELTTDSIISLVQTAVPNFEG